MKKIIKKIYHLLPFKQQIFSVIRVLPLPVSLTQHLHFEGIIKVKVEKGKSFKMQHYGFQIENELFWQGMNNGWEKISMNIWKELSRQSTVVFDIGANTGVYGLVTKSVNPESVVYAFEPVKRVYEKLEKNVSLNNFDINCFELALSDQDGMAVFYDSDSPHVYSVAINKNIAALENPIEVPVEIQKLSTFIEKYKIERIDLMKIDVETHEPEVLKGMGNYLTLFKPAILIEILNQEVANQVEELVKNIGYLYFNIDEKGLPKQTPHINQSEYYNYLLCSRSQAEMLGFVNQ